MGAALRRLVVMAWLLVSVVSWAAAPRSELGGPLMGRTWQGELGAAGERLYARPGVEGDYLAVRLNGRQGRIQLVLLDSNGKLQRLLIDTRKGESEAHFVAKGRQQWRLVGEIGAVYHLEVFQHWPRGQQPSSEEDYLSADVAALANRLAAGQTVEDLWRKIEARGTPLLALRDDDHYVLTFLYRGATENVRILGAPSGDHDAMTRLSGSDIWFKSYIVPADTRLSYKLAPDVPVFPGPPRARRVAILATAQADPLNRHPWPAGVADPFRYQSTISLPKAPPQRGLDDSGGVKGQLQALEFHSQRLGNRRSVILYRPPGFNADNPRNHLLVLFDGEDYLSKVPTPRILDNLIAQNKLPPMAAVFVSNPAGRRSLELPGDRSFAAAIAEELLPWVEAQLGMSGTARRRVLAGSSFGGLAATRIAMLYPDVFGSVISLSASHWWSPPGTPQTQSVYWAARLARQPKVPVRLFISAGLFEQHHAGAAGILETNRHVRDVLLAKGYELHYREYAAAHDYYYWRGALADGLLELFGAKK